MNKTIITTIAASAMAMSAFAQGQFTLSASAGTVEFETSPGNATAVTAFNGQPTITGFGNLNLQVWSATAGSSLVLDSEGVPQLSGPWALDTTSTSPIKVFPSAGALSGGTVVTPASSGAVTGGNVEVVLVGWTGASTSLAAAETAGSDLMGFTTAWLQSTAVAPAPTPGTAAGALGAGGLTVTSVPEPTTIALGGLGAAALMFFRRRK